MTLFEILNATRLRNATDGRRADGFAACSAIFWVIFAASRIFAQSPVEVSAPKDGRISETPFAAHTLMDFALIETPSMRMPTDVSVTHDGRVYIADGVNDRVLAFGSDGALQHTIHRVGDTTLSRPVGIDVDDAGHLWIADSGNGRLVVADVTGNNVNANTDAALIRIIKLPAADGDHRPDPTDVAVSGDGNRAWTPDNDRHVLIRHDVSRGTHTVVGRLGEAPGQLHYPFMLAVDSKARVYATDVLNGRIVVFSDTGGVVTAISQYGVEPGMLYRPKGVTCDTADNVWVSDSVTGVVQVFTSAGRFLDVLRDGAGRPFKFAAPMGLTFDSAGNLYVVELDADRVRKLAIRRGPIVSIREQRPQPRASIVGKQARACTVCHMEWVEPLAQNRATELMDPPVGSADHPYVSQPHTCLSCHDGGIVDSRRRVWLEHGHRTDIVPLADMIVPPQLPLVDGKIACRTCHSAHAGGDLSGNLKTSVFLRMPNTSGEMCVTCHADKTRGPGRGTHPTGGMPWAVPQELVTAGARPGPNPRELTCNICHTPHGAAHDHLLVMGTESNQLCLSCHDQMRPGMFREDEHRFEGGATAAREHPLNPIVNAEQKSAVQSLGTRLGPEDRLICLSCHKLHHGKGERFMLAAELTDGAFCIGCHSEKSSVLATPHDLREKLPNERNRLGMTAQSGGPCSSCHLFHRYARSPEISEVDPRGGKCITCHQPGRCAGEKSLGSVNHPMAACTDCHDPHQLKHGDFLREQTPALCAKCHAGYETLAGGPHDHRVNGQAWPQAANLSADVARDPHASPPDLCLSCHRTHGNEETGLFTFAPAPSDSVADGACIACHPGAAWGHGATSETLHGSPHAAMHPRVIPAGFSTGQLPLAHSAATDASVVGCRTCHNPHVADGHERKFLRADADQPTFSLCVKCHSTATAIALTGHAADTLSGRGMQSESCLPCHSVHAMPSAIEDELLWPRALAFVNEHRPSHGPAGADARHGPQVEDQRCEACHRPNGPARPPIIATHPDMPMLNLLNAEAPGNLPLYDAEGRANSQGEIACRTCHTPHGQLPDAEFASTDRSREKLRSARLMLRPFRAPNVCTTCHGQDAIERFLYFHDPSRRNPPRSASMAAAPVSNR